MSTDTIEKADTAAELVTIEPVKALAVFTGGKEAMAPYFARIRAEIDKFEPDLSTATSRGKIKSMAFKVAQSKTYLDGVGKKLYADQSEIPKKISAARKLIETTLDAWRDEVRAPLTAWEKAEDDRVKKHTLAIAQISRLGIGDGLNVSDLRHALANLASITIDDRCEEFQDEYAAAKTRSTNALTSILALRVQYEAEQAELQQLRAEAARRAEADRERQADLAKAELLAKTERNAAIARDAAIKAQIAEAERLAVLAESPAAVEQTDVVDALPTEQVVASPAQATAADVDYGCGACSRAQRRISELEGDVLRLRVMLRDCVRVMKPNIYPKPDVDADHPYAVLKRAQALISA